jgi:hypothetical protein
MRNGGCARTRTVDPLIKSQLLYQLSYTPEVPYHGSCRSLEIVGSDTAVITSSLSNSRMYAPEALPSSRTLQTSDPTE